MNIKTLSVSLTALCLSAAAPAADMLLENYGSSRPAWLSKLKKLDRSSDGKFRILQIGDSHTAGDLFTEQLRLRLQQKWGDGGIGWVYPSTVKGQRSAAVRYDGSWQTVSSRSVSDDFPLGGIIAKANGSSVTISAKDGSSGERQISVFAKPVLPEQTLSFNGREVPAGSSGWQIIRSNGRLPLTLSSSMPWDIGYINIENPGRGVTVSALGINGAQLTHWSKWRPSWQDDLAQTRADLVIIAYGTNEAFARDLDITATEQLHPPNQTKPARRRHPDSRRARIPKKHLRKLRHTPRHLKQHPTNAATHCPRRKNHVLVVAERDGRRMQHEKLDEPRPRRQRRRPLLRQRLPPSRRPPRRQLDTNGRLNKRSSENFQTTFF